MLLAYVSELTYIPYLPFVSYISLIAAAPFLPIIVASEEILCCAQDDSVMVSLRVVEFCVLYMKGASV